MPQPDETSDEPPGIGSHDARSPDALRKERRARLFLRIELPFIAIMTLVSLLSMVACTASDDEEAACGGVLLTAPADGAGSFTVAQLMAHSAAMGMTQQEAETLIYLEGLSPTTRLEPGESRCLDGKPG